MFTAELDSNKLATEKEKKAKRPSSAHKAKPAKQVFYTEFKNEVGRSKIIPNFSTL